MKGAGHRTANSEIENLGAVLGGARNSAPATHTVYAFPFLLLLNEGNYIQEVVSLIDFRT